MKIKIDTDVLVNSEIISKEISDKICDFYKKEKYSSNNNVYTIFGILGSILILLGIILLLAHNWENLSKNIKITLTFCPLVLSQLLCIFTLIRKYQSQIWRECSAILLFVSSGSSIALIGNIYNLSSDIEYFMLTWMFLCLPLIYIMKSSLSSIFLLIGISYYGLYVGYFSVPNKVPIFYWLLLLCIFPHFIYLKNSSPKSNYYFILNILIPLSITIIFGAFSKRNSEFIFISYLNIFYIFYTLSKSNLLKIDKIKSGFYYISICGTIILLYILSFKWFWISLSKKTINPSIIFSTSEIFIALATSVISIILFLKSDKKNEKFSFQYMEFSFMALILLVILSYFSTFPAILINIYIILIGVFKIIDGIKNFSISKLNLGLILIALIIVSRFFDSKIDFVIKAFFFIGIGIGFFVSNYYLLKKRSSNE